MVPLCVLAVVHSSPEKGNRATASSFGNADRRRSDALAPVTPVRPNSHESTSQLCTTPSPLSWPWQSYENRTTA